MKKIESFISVIAPLYNDKGIVEGFTKEVAKILKQTYSNYEIVLIDNFSNDGTPSIVENILKEVDCVRYIRLPRQHDEEVAISAGLDTVIGDFVVIMSPSLDPPELIPEVVEYAKTSNGVVFGVLKNRKGQGIFTRIGTKLFYWYAKKVLKLNMPENTTDLRVLSRKVVNAIIKIKESNRYLTLLSTYTGFSSETFHYTQKQGGRKKKKSFLRQLRFAKNIVVSNSIHPLRFVTFIGFTASLLNFLYLLYIVAIYILKDDIAEGWTTVSFQNASMFFMIFLILTVLSEYIGEILKESKSRPLYYVSDEKCSSVLVSDENRLNIVKDSHE